MTPRCFKQRRAFEPPSARGRVRGLLVLLGDQLNIGAAALEQLSKQKDAILMMEVADEATHVPSHRQRTTLFLSAMRHFANELHKRHFRVHYIALDDPDNTHTLAGEIERAAERLKPDEVVYQRPGEWRVLRMIESAAERLGIAATMIEESHFLISPDDFSQWVTGRKTVVLEHFYRMMRRRLNVLVDDAGEPVGGAWNFDTENRRPYRGDPPTPAVPSFNPDPITREVIDLVQARFDRAYGTLDTFDWPTKRSEALAALDDFIHYRLPLFGTYQDAMSRGQPWMFHSLLSPMINLKLLDPREVVQAAVDAYESGHAPLNSVEGFIRQVIGWREFIRGVYWQYGSDYGRRNGLDQYGDLPPMYWSGDTDMACMHEALSQVIEHGYGHHIQRLMVTGNFALISGVHPRAISEWYLGMYVDAVDWVTLPNTLGMVMHADGGVVGTKPYAASGQYIKRMSDYCSGCRYRPAERISEHACPFTTFYWDFLLRNESRFRKNNRMSLILRQLGRIDSDQRDAIATRANALRQDLGVGDINRRRT